MEKKSLRIVAFVFLIFLGVALFFLLKDNKPKTVETEDSLKFKKEYEEVNKDNNAVKVSITSNNPIVYLSSFDELKTKIDNNEKFVLYLGFQTCPWCRSIINVLFDAANDNNYEVYYINTKKLKQNSVEDYESLYNLLYDYLEEDNEGKKTLYVPDVYFFSNSKIMGHHLGSVDSQTNPGIVLNNKQKKELKSIYQSLFDKLK